MERLVWIFSPAPWCVLLHQRLVWTKETFMGFLLGLHKLATIRRSLCALSPVSWILPLHCHRACVYLFQLTDLPSMFAGLVHSSLGSPSSLCVPQFPICTRGLYVTSLACQAALCTTRVCELERDLYVCPLWHPGPALRPVGASVGYSWFSQAHHSPWAVYGHESAAFSVFYPSKSLFCWFLRICSTLLCLHVKFLVHRKSSSSGYLLPPGEQAPVQKFLHLSLFVFSIHSPTSF